jgi:hypothetical protein
MAKYKNNTGGVSKVGFIAKVDPNDKNAFIYAGISDSSVLGVITQGVQYRRDCEIANLGTAKVFIPNGCQKGDIIRSRKASDGITNGSSIKSKSADTPFIQIGTALESGNGLINCQLNIFYFGGGGGSSSGGDVLLADTYNKDAVGGILLCSQYNP